MQIAPDKTLEELFKSRWGQLMADSEYATGAISQHVKAVSYGLVALIIPFVTAEPDKLPKLLKQSPEVALLCSALGFMAVCSDILQNHYADQCARNELKRIERNLKEKNLCVDSPSDFMLLSSVTSAAKRRQFFYVMKIILAVAGTLVLFIFIANVFFDSSIKLTKILWNL